VTDPQDHDSLDLALALTRTELSPSSADKVRLRAALGLSARGAQLDVPDAAPAVRTPEPVAAAGAAPAQLTPLQALHASGKVGATLGVALFAAGLAIGWGLQSRASEAPAPHTGEPAPAVAVEAATPVAAVSAKESVSGADRAARPAAPTAAEEPAPRRSEHTPQRSRSHSAAVAAPSTAQPLDAELALLRRVERALRNGDPALALALLAELDDRYPQTRLAEERLAARTIADCRLDHPDAAARARAFLRERPASVYSERVQSACALETPATGSTR
jgi:hypothetical protein